MPELPEVETLRQQLEKAIVGKTISEIKVLREKSFKGEPQSLVGKRVKKVERVAKIIIIKIFNFQSFDKLRIDPEQSRMGQFSIFNYLLIHLKLTGQLIYQDRNKRVYGGHPTPDWVNALPSKHTRVMIHFSDGSKLFFNDLRVFGWLKVVEGEEGLGKEIKGFGGIEPLTAAFTLEKFKKQLQRTSRPIKLALMDQALIAGVGNIYSNDALWEAKINPRKPAKELSTEEIKKLKESLEKVLKLGVKYGGASENTYRQLSGLGGRYQKHFLVYQREGEECRRCGEKIKKFQLGGRGTYSCSRCQE